MKMPEDRPIQAWGPQSGRARIPTIALNSTSSNHPGQFAVEKGKLKPRILLDGVIPGEAEITLGLEPFFRGPGSPQVLAGVLTA